MPKTLARPRHPPHGYPQSEQDVDGIFSKSGTGIAEERHQNRRACTDVPLLAERNSKHPDRPYGFAKYRQSGLDIYAWHGMYFFPAFRSSTSTASAGCAWV
ncbi:hypothetical protein BN1095_6750001 [Clostridioides difficile]|uniref:Uncharacterized protein n=1 Tax=Clostridioides difficile TaxID=1496 RepID=A0A069AUU6_CLODI|nr:hypothetical protein BN1095_6750001 [Clostridioides difficile]